MSHSHAFNNRRVLLFVFAASFLLLLGLPMRAYADTVPDQQAEPASTTVVGDAEGQSDMTGASVSDTSGSAGVTTATPQDAGVTATAAPAATGGVAQDPVGTAAQDPVGTAGTATAGTGDATAQGSGTGSETGRAAGDAPDATGADPAQATPTPTATATTAAAPTATATTAKATATAKTPSAPVDGVYTVASSLKSSARVEIGGASGADGARAQVHADNWTAAQRWYLSSLGNGYYKVRNVASGKYLDVAGARVGDGARVQQWAWNGSRAQQWAVVPTSSGYLLRSALSTAYVLDLAGASTRNGTAVQLYRSNGTGAQRWTLSRVTAALPDGFYRVTSEGSGKALDVAGGSVRDGANVRQYAANGSVAQGFRLSYGASNGYYTVLASASGLALDVGGATDRDGANVQLYSPNGSAAQRWALVRNADGSYTLRSAVGGRVLDVSAGSKADGANVQTWAWNGTAAQRWAFSGITDWLPEGVYTLLARINNANVVDIAGGSLKDGANIQVYSGNSTNAQRFYLRKAGNGYYTIQNPISGKYVNIASRKSGGNSILGSTRQQFKPVLQPGGIVFQLKEDTKLVLDVAGASDRSGSNLQVYTSNGTAAQRFMVQRTDMFSNGTYSIRYAANSSFVIDVPGASDGNGVQMQLYQSNGTAAQRFRLKRVAENTYQIVSTVNGKALQMVKMSNGSYQLQQRAAASSGDQQWKLLLAADGTIQLAPKANTGLRVDLSSNSVQNSTPIVVYTSNNSAAQKWKMAAEREPTTYDALGLTLRRMAQLQQTGRYRDMSIEQLMNLLDPDKINRTQFLNLRVTTGVSADQLNAFIVSTSTGQSGVLKGLGSAFVSASRACGLNEVYLLSHAILESGWGTSELARGYHYGGGTIDGRYYAAGTYYNFYGIGAYDSSPLSGGRKLAIINGWNTREKAVTGAARWIADHYVYADSYAQPTLYAMKWDYARSSVTNERGWHQYATSVSWPDGIASLMDRCYARSGGNPNPTYVIPRYK